jgi:hypothetical protein
MNTRTFLNSRFALPVATVLVAATTAFTIAVLMSPKRVSTRTGFAPVQVNFGDLPVDRPNAPAVPQPVEVIGHPHMTFTMTLLPVPRESSRGSKAGPLGLANNATQPALIESNSIR